MRCFAVLLASSLVVLPARSQDHRALITEISGTVQVTRANGAGAAATWGLQLFDGDLVTTGPDSKAALLYANGGLHSLAANAEARVSTGAPGGRAVDPTLLADVSDLTLHRTGVGELAALGGLRSGGSSAALDPESPRHSRVRATTPVFSWSAHSDFELYTVEVLSDQGPYWQGTTTETSLIYPVSAPALTPGTTYYWRVAGEEMLDVTKSELVPFQVIGEDEAGRIAAGEQGILALFTEAGESASRDYMLGSFYAKAGLNQEAISVFSSIAARQGGSALIHEILGKLYYETGRKDLAVASLQEALRQARTP